MHTTLLTAAVHKGAELKSFTRAPICKRVDVIGGGVPTMSAVATAVKTQWRWSRKPEGGGSGCWYVNVRVN